MLWPGCHGCTMLAAASVCGACSIPSLTGLSGRIQYLCTYRSPLRGLISLGFLLLLLITDDTVSACKAIRNFLGASCCPVYPPLINIDSSSSSLGKQSLQDPGLPMDMPRRDLLDSRNQPCHFDTGACGPVLSTFSSLSAIMVAITCRHLIHNDRKLLVCVAQFPPCILQYSVVVRILCSCIAWWHICSCTHTYT